MSEALIVLGVFLVGWGLGAPAGWAARAVWERGYRREPR